jgi:ATP-binding cassette subfamily B protein
MKQIWRIVRFTTELKRYYFGIGAFTILLGAMSQVQPLLTKGALDTITAGLQNGQTDIPRVAMFAGLIFLTDVAQTLFSNFGGYLGDIVNAKLRRLMSQRYFAHMLSLPQQYFDAGSSGQIINRMSRGITQITDYVQTLTNNFLQFIFSTIFTLAIVFYFSWQVGLMMLLIYPVYIYMTTRTSGKWLAYQKTINEEQDYASGRFAEAISQVKVVKSYLQEKRELKVFDKHFGKVEATTYPQSKYWHSRDIGRRLVLNVIFFGIFAYIFIATARGQYTIGTMVLLIQYAIQIRIPIFTISYLVDATQRAVGNTREYFEAMDTEPAVVDTPEARQLRVKQAAITFDQVKFGYDNKTVLRDIDFAIEPGSKVALVGESGEGKTTITNLLLRLYDVQGGSISIDGQDISRVTQASLRKHIAVVFQEPALFSGTIRENIAYARPKATQTELEKAARAANAHEFITKFEKGYDTEIGERGLKLSGGQKQRIAIARALLKDAPILILDEATSSLDSRSERAVQQALERLMKGRTTLIIAHRLSTIQSVDQVITLENGKVDEIGSPADLAASGGIYARLLAMQQAPDRKQDLKKFGIS